MRNSIIATILGIFITILCSCKKDDGTSYDYYLIGEWDVDSLVINLDFNHEPLLEWLVVSYSITESEAQGIIDDVIADVSEGPALVSIDFIEDRSYVEKYADNSTGTGSWVLSKDLQTITLNGIYLDILSFSKNIFIFYFNFPYDLDLEESGPWINIGVSYYLSKE